MKYRIRLQQYLPVTYLFRIMIIGYSERNVTGMLTLSPMSVTPVCHVGNPLQLTCTAHNVEFLRWNVLRVNEQGDLVDVFRGEIINSRDMVQMRDTPDPLSSATFTFTRISAQYASPLISTLSIDSVNIGLNGTVVHCTDIANPMTSASTTIQIIDTSENFLYTPRLRIIEEQYGINSVTVTVEWTQNVGVTYTAKVSPMVPLISVGETNRRLIILYNTVYNFSVVAATPCRPNATNSTMIDYANCGHPEVLFTARNGSVPKVVRTEDFIPVEGSIVTFSCPPGFELIGPDTATCTENGKWEPDPSVLICNCSSSEGSESRSTCSRVLVAALSSTVVISVVISVMLFIIGFLCGNYYNVKFRSSKRATTIDQPHQLQAPEYEDIDTQQVARAVKRLDQPFELKENVAYGPSKIHDK